MPFFDHDNHSLHYEICGVSDPVAYTPILMLHGNGEDMTVFGDTVAHLLNSNTIILLDSRMHGRSVPFEGASAELHYSDMADDALALMEYLGAGEYDVVGYSDGGIIALMMAMRSMSIRKVITIGANTDPGGLTLRARLMMKRARSRALAIGDERTQELQRLMLEEPHITLSDLSRIIAEVTVIRGSRDPFIKLRHSEQIADAIPHGSHMSVEGAGHGIPETHAAQLAEIMRTVL